MPASAIDLQAGEHYAGLVLDAETGQPLHHLVLLAALPDQRLTWQSAMDWAANVGGTLPTRQEQALLFANCKHHLAPMLYWSSELYEGEASVAWGCGFYHGNQGFTVVGSEASAAAVRRLSL